MEPGHREDIEWYVGLDWASQTHRVHLADRDGRRVGERDVAHGGAGLGELCDWLTAKTGAAPGRIGVAIEVPRGPVVEMLMGRGFAVFSINPKQLDRFRDRFSVAGAKDDSRDAQVLASSLRTDARAFRRLTSDDPVVIELREWSRIADDLQQERCRLANRVREQLWRFYPQMLEVADGDLAADWILDLIEMAPTPVAAARLRKSKIAGLLAARRIRRLDAGQVQDILRRPPLAVAAGTSAAATAHIATVAARLRLINQQLRQAHRKLDELCDRLETPPPDDASDAGAGDAEASGEPDAGDAASQMPPRQASVQPTQRRDVAILRSLPGVGRINLATLLAEAAEPLRRRDYRVLRALSGVAPVTRRSGKSRLVVRRHACNGRLRDAVYHWARVASQKDPASKARYAELRRRGHTHGRALRTIGDRLLGLACTLLQRQVLFDPDLFDPDHVARQPAGAA